MKITINDFKNWSRLQGQAFAREAKTNWLFFSFNVAFVGFSLGVLFVVILHKLVG